MFQETIAKRDPVPEEQSDEELEATSKTDNNAE